MSWKDQVKKKLESVTGKETEILSVSSVGGGSINETFRVETLSGLYFVKINSSSLYPGMFEKEALGLKILEDAGEIPVPEVVAWDETNEEAFLTMKYIPPGTKSTDFWETFAKRLAALHRHTDEMFGLDHNNYIGSLPQSNRRHKSWTDFFREERLEFQVKMARNAGKIGNDTVKRFERFYKKLDEIFPVEPPSLIHGDLWGGNFIVNPGGEAVIIDPAVYYGHREMDLGMSQLFGGFSERFYKAYNHHFPLDKGWQQRLDYCNLYPLMVHVNLFGGGYSASVNSILKKFQLVRFSR